jgi:hypothetical protein
MRCLDPNTWVGNLRVIWVAKPSGNSGVRAAATQPTIYLLFHDRSKISKHDREPPQQIEVVEILVLQLNTFLCLQFLANCSLDLFIEIWIARTGNNLPWSLVDAIEVYF